MFFHFYIYTFMDSGGGNGESIVCICVCICVVCSLARENKRCDNANIHSMYYLHITDISLCFIEV